MEDSFNMFESLVGYEYEFYGVDSNVFCIGINGNKVAFEAIEDPNDGYRSYLSSVEVKLDGHIFFDKPLAVVRLLKVLSSGTCNDKRWKREYEFTGYELIDVIDDHVWLKVGTDHNDSYYPSFIFTYHPKLVQHLDLNVKV